MAVELYRVGGSVRDQQIGRKSKDIDYAVEATSYEEMRQYIIDNGGIIFQSKPEFLVIRAHMPELGWADFVLCRKDGIYVDGRHPESVEPGTIYDDLARRDFTMNAKAIRMSDLMLIDPYNGSQDIDNRLIRCVGNTEDRFNEDALRILRALRFSVTLGFHMSVDIIRALRNKDVVDKLRDISGARIRDELVKMFSHDAKQTLYYLSYYQGIADIAISKGINFMPTFKQF